MKESLFRNVDVPILPREDADIRSYLKNFVNSYKRNLMRFADRVEDIASIFEATKDPTGFEDPDDSTISFNDGTRTFTISPVNEGYTLWFRGDRVTKTADETAVITDTEGVWVFYFDEDGVLKTGQGVDIADIVVENILVAYVYWDATNNVAIYIGDERHGLMPHQIHRLWHLTNGTQYISGLAIGGILADQSGALDSHAQFSVTAGTIVDEDIWHEISAYLTSTNRYVFYKSGAVTWRRSAGATAGVITTGSGRAAWNQFTMGSWQQTEVANNNFVLAHVVATNDITNQIIVIQGENEYTTIVQAREGANDEVSDLISAGLPFQEFVFIGTIIYQTSNSYSNTWKSRIRTTDTGDDYVDWRFQSLSPGNGPGSHTNQTDRDQADSHPADAISTDVSAFGAILSASETEVQAALDILDDHVHDGRYYTESEIDTALDTRAKVLNLSASAGTPQYVKVLTTLAYDSTSNLYSYRIRITSAKTSAPVSQEFIIANRGEATSAIVKWLELAAGTPTALLQVWRQADKTDEIWVGAGAFEGISVEVLVTQYTASYYLEAFEGSPTTTAPSTGTKTFDSLTATPDIS